MADFTQQRFLGASITQFNCSIGWSNQTSQLNVGLVEDDVVGDRFVPVDIGSPVQFNYQGWIFNGLLQSWKRSDSQGGSPLYEVTVIDPREILEGVQVIIADYPGSTNGIFNLLNVYGYYESVAFGNSDVNEAGMSWYYIQQGIHSLTAIGQSSTYGTQVRFNQSSYSIDLSALPQLPYWYRIGGTNVSVMDFVTDVCEAGGCDFFFVMTQTAASTFVISLVVANRRVLPQLGQIANFIQNQGNITSSNYGYELLNNNTGKFVVGGNIEKVYINSTSLDRITFRSANIKYNSTVLRKDGFDGTSTWHYYDGNVWPFWGFNPDGSYIIGIGNYYSNGHYFILDSRSIDVGGVGAWYATDIGEIRSAADSFESWMFYLSSHNNDSESPAYGRYTKIGGISPLNDNLMSLLTGADPTNPIPAANISQIPWAHLAAVTTRQRKLAAGSSGSGDLENLMRLYDFVREYGAEYYGKKFMVRVPFIFTKVENETFKQVLSQDPINEGFLDEDTWDSAIGDNLLPFDINRLTTEDGKIEAYVRFDNATNLDLSDVSDDDFVFSENKQSVFVKCRVEPTLVYLDVDTFYAPRAIIDLSGPVRILNRLGDQQSSQGQIIDTLNLLFSQNFPNMAQADKDAAIKKAIDAWQAQGASESMFVGKAGKAVLPNIVGLPLHSNIETYGPWYIQGASGKLDFEKDDSLVPWNYNGYEVMNEAANAKIIQALTNQIIQESGTVEFPGVPEVQLGIALIGGGPLVTDINVTIGQQGATTTYRMQLAPRFGKFAKNNVDRLTRLSKTQQRFRRNLRELNKEMPSNHLGFKVRENIKGLLKGTIKPNQLKNLSSHLLLHGECIQNSGDTYHVNTCTQPGYNFTNQSYTNYGQKGIMSLDGLIVPFSTDINASGIPHYSGIVSNSGDVYRDIINPYVANHGIQHLARDYVLGDSDTLYENGIYSSGNIYRGAALRGPLTIAGWSYDINGNPTPSGSDGNFISNVRQKPDKWNVGPVDLRWDDERKIYVAGTSNTVLGLLDGNIRAASMTFVADSGGNFVGNGVTMSTFNVKLMSPGGGNLGLRVAATTTRCYNPYPNLSADVSASGVTVIALSKINGKYIPVSVDCYYG